MPEEEGLYGELEKDLYASLKRKQISKKLRGNEAKNYQENQIIEDYHI